MNWIQKILALIQFAPSILQLIVAIEGIFGAGNGSAKKALVMATLPDSTPPEITDGVSKMVDKHVAALNSAGVFKKG